MIRLAAAALCFAAFGAGLGVAIALTTGASRDTRTITVASTRTVTAPQHTITASAPTAEVEAPTATAPGTTCGDWLAGNTASRDAMLSEVGWPTGYAAEGRATVTLECRNLARAGVNPRVVTTRFVDDALISGLRLGTLTLQEQCAVRAALGRQYAVPCG